ncbi:hypothetical protein K523DRAFT_353678 [Schizophyllum commune Tattone D]|nr:hypothetical protein K523DRAFT_353678 [Schizophyllum commune Tattone D]
MAEPATIAREARGLHAGLKEFLKTRDPWDREVEFQRQDLRRRYLSLLLLHPYANEAKDAETHLWMQTSYSFITVYKQRIAAIDRAIQHGARPGPNNQRGHGPVEHRKLTQRFRQFLADEDKFWAQFAARFRRAFALREANHAFLELKLATQDELEGKEDAPPPTARSQHHFPDPPPYTEPMTDEQRHSRLSILSKALICMGDIARYREQYNESGGRPRAGHEEHELLAPLKRERGGRRGRNKEPNLERRPRNYDRAQLCYEHARRLVPDDGNPSHQMAIIASYQNDVFSSVVHYYRALCVRQPYEPAADNLATVFNKALDQYKRRKQQEHEKNEKKQEEGEVNIRARIEGFKEKIVVIHALWRHTLSRNGSEKPLDSLLRKLTSSACTDFHFLISQRHLPPDVIEDVMILAQAALWKHRMLRDKTSSSEMTEYRIFAHLLLMHRTLLEVGIDELKDATASAPSPTDLAQRITGEFRRTLSALRIASKWLQANYAYVMENWDPQCIADARKMGRGARERDKDSKKGSTMLVKFWQKYADFSRALARAFPEKELPKLTVPLEEDVDMRGFLPLKKQMDGQGVGAFEDQAAQEHPNVLQLMRISDLLADARTLAKREDAPIALYGNQFALKGVESQVADEVNGGSSSENGGVSTNVPRSSVLEIEEDLPEGISVNDDEVVRKAFDHLNTAEDEMEVDDEEQIVWDPRAPSSPSRARSKSISNMPSMAEDPIVPSMPAKSTMAPIGSPITPLKPISPTKDSSADRSFSLFPMPPADAGAKNASTSLLTSPYRVTEMAYLEAKARVMGSPSSQASGPPPQGAPTAKDAASLRLSIRGMTQSPAVGTTAQDLVKSMMAPRRLDGRQSAMPSLASPPRVPGTLGVSASPLTASSTSPPAQMAGPLGSSALGGVPVDQRFGPQVWGEQSHTFGTPSIGTFNDPLSANPHPPAALPSSMYGQQPVLSQPPTLSQQTLWSSQGSQGLGAMPSAPFAPQPMGGLSQASLPPSHEAYPLSGLGHGGGLGYAGGPAGYGEEAMGYGRETLAFGEGHLGYAGQPQANLGISPAHARHLLLDPYSQPHLASDPRYAAMWGNAMG